MSEENNPNGRPTLYKPEYCDEIVEFFNAVSPTKIVKKQVVQKGQVVEIKVEEPNGPPTLYGFAAKVGVDRDTLNEWANVYPAFSVAKKKAKTIQANFIVQNGMTGFSPQPFSIFMMKCNHDWNENQATLPSTEIGINIDKDDENL